MRITVANETSAHISSRIVRTTLQLAARLTKTDHRERRVEVTFLSAGKMRDLNRRYRAVDRATDVLSFAYGLEKPDGASVPKEVFGEIIIAPDCLAPRTGRSALASAVRDRLIHGYLHLIGHDHHTPRPRALMRRWEATIRRRL